MTYATNWHGEVGGGVQCGEENFLQLISTEDEPY